jgi:sigma-54-interacting transcriptional regulator
VLDNALRTEFSRLRQRAPGCAIEWDSLTARHHNVLLEGRQNATRRTIELLQPYLRESLIWRRPGQRLQLIPHRPRTLILEDIIGLNAAEQTGLRNWLDDPQSLQIISTTDRPLFPSVEQELFDERLYYRLNVMLLHVDESPEHLPHAHAKEFDGVWTRAEPPSRWDRDRP